MSVSREKDGTTVYHFRTSEQLSFGVLAVGDRFITTPKHGNVPSGNFCNTRDVFIKRGGATRNAMCIADASTTTFHGDAAVRRVT